MIRRPLALGGFPIRPLDLGRFTISRREMFRASQGTSLCGLNLKTKRAPYDRALPEGRLFALAHDPDPVRQVDFRAPSNI